MIEEIDNEADQLIKKAEAELGLRDDNYFKKQTQEVIEHVLKNAIFTNGANIEHLWTAINETNLAKMTELKSKIAGNEYTKTLIISSLFNSMLRNEEVIKFLLTETEISKYPHLKAKMLPVFFNIDNEAELNEEIIELLSIENEQAYKQELIDLLYTPHISNEYLIKSFRNISDINKPLTITVCYDNGQTLHEQEYSLLLRAIQSNRITLTEELMNRGAKLLPNEIQHVLPNVNLSEEFLINYFKNISNTEISKPLITKISYDQGKTLHEQEYSLLLRAIQSNRIKLTEELINRGIKLLPNEIQDVLWNNKVPDEIFIRSFEDIPNINKPLTINVRYDNGQTFHNEECSLLESAISSNRLGLSKYLVDRGADVNLKSSIQIPIYVTAFHKSIEFFEIVVASGRLLKEQTMDYYIANLDNQISLNLSNLYDVIAWRDKFKADLNNDILKYKNWFENSRTK